MPDSRAAEAAAQSFGDCSTCQADQDHRRSHRPPHRSSNRKASFASLAQESTAGLCRFLYPRIRGEQRSGPRARQLTLSKKKHSSPKQSISPVQHEQKPVKLVNDTASTADLEKRRLTKAMLFEVCRDESRDRRSAQVVRLVRQVDVVGLDDLAHRHVPLRLRSNSEGRPHREPPSCLYDRGQRDVDMRFQGSVARREEVETYAPWFQHAPNLGKRLVVVLHVLEDLIGENEVERIVCEGQSVRFSLDETNEVILVQTLHIRTFLEHEVTSE